MQIDGSGSQMLARDECLALLASAGIGHIAVSTEQVSGRLEAADVPLPADAPLDWDQSYMVGQHRPQTVGCGYRAICAHGTSARSGGSSDYGTRESSTGMLTS
jgi:hypothetical protein